MNGEQLKAVNSITDEYHQDIANIGEEVIDRENKAAIKQIDDLIAKLKHLKINLQRDEI